MEVNCKISSVFASQILQVNRIVTKEPCIMMTN